MIVLKSSRVELCMVCCQYKMHFCYIRTKLGILYYSGILIISELVVIVD